MSISASISVRRVQVPFILLLAALAAFLAFAPIASAAVVTNVVTPADMATGFGDVITDPTKWFFYNDENDTIDNTLGSFVVGPATAPAGTDSVQISVSGTQRRNLATYQFFGTPLADITELKFSTYNPSAGNAGSTNRSAYLNFNVDFDGSDTWQRRLIYLPADNGAVVQNTWQEWDVLQAGAAKWRYSGPTWPGTVTPGSTTKTWTEILTEYTGVRIRLTDSWLGLRVGEPYADGYTENIDKFVFAAGGDTMVFDFDLIAPPPPPPPPPSGNPTTREDCLQGGWESYGFKNQGLCIQSVNTGKDSRESSAPGLNKEEKGPSPKANPRAQGASVIQGFFNWFGNLFGQGN